MRRSTIYTLVAPKGNELVASVDRVGPVWGRVGRPRQLRERLYADKARQLATSVPLFGGRRLTGTDQ